MSSRVIDDDDDDVVFVMERKSPTVQIGHKQVPIRNIDVVNDERTKRRQQQKQLKRKRETQSTNNNAKDKYPVTKKLAKGNDLLESSHSTDVCQSNVHLANKTILNSGDSREVLDYFKFLECQGKENPCSCKEFEPMASDAKQCTCGHRRGNHNKIDKSEWEKSAREFSKKESTTITNNLNDSDISIRNTSRDNMDTAESSSSEHEGPIAASSPLKNSKPLAPPAAATPIRDTENSTAIDVSDSQDESLSNDERNRLDKDPEFEEEPEPEKPKHYPMIPFYSCPPELRKKLGQLPFKKRIVVEKFISTKEIEWSYLDHHTFKRIKDATKMDEVIKCIEDKIRHKQQSMYLVHLGEADTEGFTLTKNRAWLMNATVGADEITFEGPYMEETNRVIREYGPDRFLRVSFKIAAFGEHKLKKVFRAVLRNGIWFAGRFYEFLCFSASQLREQKCYFFASKGIGLPHKTAGDVRVWLGNFDNITSLPKLGARLGQPFSRTTPTVKIPKDQVKRIPDIEKNGYCFTDGDSSSKSFLTWLGCGEISPEFAKRVADEMQLEDVPSAFQVRWGPCKGVLMLNNNIHNTVHFRNSMWKYEIPDPTDSQETIEVIKISKGLKGLNDSALPTSTGHLNRQFIVLLEGLGIPTEYFVKLQEDAINKLLDITQTKKAALACLQSDENVDSLQSKAVGMLLAGHSPEEPYLRNLLLQIQENQLNQIKEKARIHVPNSRVLLGVCDSSGLLKPDEGEVQHFEPSLLIKQTDFRLLQAVDIPELRHLVDVIVFPTTGERPIADQIAGGDLDGDQFFVTWDSELTKIKPYPPMDYRQLPLPPNPIPENYIPALQDYFVDSMFSTALGVISNLHAKFADMYGPTDPMAIELAQLHSRAVDAAKTGDIVKIPEYISHHNEKSWPHFMGKEDSYISKRCLGVLYNKVLERLKLLRDGTMKEVVMDDALLLKGREVYALEARRMLRDYNSKMTKALCISDPELKAKAIENIFKHFRTLFESGENENSAKKTSRTRSKKENNRNVSDKDPQDNFALYLKASAWYEATYEDKKSKEGKSASMSHALTFVWNICDDYLNRIKADSDRLKLRGRLAPTVGTDVVKELCFKS